MGHHVGSKNSIVPLIDRLNKYPVGLPDSDKLREILSLLFAENEAFIASRFPLQEATLEELTKATAIPAEDLLPQLERMCDKGLVMDLPYEGEVYYLLMPGLIGFFEFTFMKNRTDLPKEKIARLMQEYMHENPRNGMAKEFFDSKTPLTRALPYEDKIPVSSTVTSYENAREIINNAGYGAVGLCYCRHKKHHLGEDCQKGAPMEDICISLGTGAKFLVRRGFAKEQTPEQLLEILDRARALNLTHITDNIRQKPSFICNCCSCCCELLAGVQAGYTDGIAKAPFILQIDENLCNSCGLCVQACNVAALEVVAAKQPVRLQKQVCLGCGACISVCKQKALSMVAREETYLPPLNRTEMMKKRLFERGRATPFIVSGIKKKIKKLIKGKPERTNRP
ncbi:4Fe-4S binding protein [uncultured Desulfuromusa sp.]|uniref:4Fe-4S binding protein n=1 Tax=uncultured Desulfuromusa sp. TaxID=219183 RepID=UPI002AA6FAA3|nr:4Fe-4S binding protein [uncultured Desulfuromusa sp.]